MNMLGLLSSVKFAHIRCYWKFFLLHYTLVLCQYRFCKVDHAYLTYLMLQRQLSHLNGRKPVLPSLCLTLKVYSDFTIPPLERHVTLVSRPEDSGFRNSRNFVSTYYITRYQNSEVPCLYLNRHEEHKYHAGDMAIVLTLMASFTPVICFLSLYW
jgi:hypothetical protein